MGKWDQHLAVHVPEGRTGVPEPHPDHSKAALCTHVSAVLGNYAERPFMRQIHSKSSAEVMPDTVTLAASVVLYSQVTERTEFLQHPTKPPSLFVLGF